MTWFSYLSLSRHIDQDAWRASGQCLLSVRRLMLSLISLLRLCPFFNHTPLSLSSDEYKMKGVEEVKYMRGDENRVNARNQENLVRHTHTDTHTHTHWQPVIHIQTQAFSLTVHQDKRTGSCLCPKASSVSLASLHTHLSSLAQAQVHTNTQGVASHAGTDDMLACVECVGWSLGWPRPAKAFWMEWQWWGHFVITTLQITRLFNPSWRNNVNN